MKRIDRIYIMIAKVKNSKYYDLPKEILLYIWSFDDTYIMYYKYCMYELEDYFNKNRICDLLKGEQIFYELFKKRKHQQEVSIYSMNPNGLSYSQYILNKLYLFKIDTVAKDNLKYVNLNKIEINKKK